MNIATTGREATRRTASSTPGAVGDAEVVEWVERAQAGSAEAFGALYDRYVDGVFAYVLHRVGNRATAEELVGDVFVRALRRIGSFRWQGADFGAWLMVIARNRVHDHFKSARFRMEATVEEVFDRPMDDDPDAPERTVLTAELAAQVHAALRSMKADQAEVLQLRFLNHLGVTETAAVMRRSEGAVKALQHRALKSLAKVISTTAPLEDRP